MFCYIASLPQGAPFQMSIHSWTPPSFSTKFMTHMRDHAIEADKAAWGVKVMIDGHVVA